jgi:WD40 repeat protein/tRNA A-37 threonylcarbamoyl transferase component Bud32
LQQIGEGGMGVVFMAEQEQPIRRRVALKIIKPGMDSAQVIARFEVERQALALMDHQSIARVLDAGTTDSGRPYFVMELVHGVPITQYCDANKLSLRQRLELFVPVCQAIQHAHQKGIIHRDIKQSNIMVTLHDGQPVPKVIDFGVAKATEQRLTERTLFTQYGTIVGTLEYMAPEQAEMSGLGVDTRGDIYSLGVLLYELLTGTTPLERSRLREAAYDEMLRLIREEEPPRPSQRISTSGDRLATISAERNTEPAELSRLVCGELDWIIMCCLEKDRTRRYETANGLARDIQHYLADEPVEACPPSTGYKLRKFARKHKAGLATAAGFAVLLVLGTAVSTWQAVRATQAEAVALVNEHQANDNAVQAQEKEREAYQQRNEVQALNEKLQATQAELRRTLYVAEINLAQRAWEAGGAGQVRELLEKQRPKPGESDLRNFEWHYLNRLCHAEIFTLEGGGWGVAFSPDGKRLASAAGGDVKVWNAQTGKELRTFTLKDAVERIPVFSPDGKRVASCCDNDYRIVKVWDTQSGQELLAIRGNTSGVRGMAFSPDGQHLAGGSLEGTLKVWDAQTGQELLTCKGHTAAVNGVAFSPDGKHLASASNDNTGRLWNAQTGQEVWTFRGHTRFVNGVAFSPDGKHLASASGDHLVKVWDVQTGQELLTIRGHSDWVRSVTFSPDGKHLASASADNTVKVWDAQTGQKPLTLKAGTTPVAGVAFSPDGKRLASISTEPGGGKVWDAQTGQQFLRLQGVTTAGASGLAFSPDGKRLASGNAGGSGFPHVNVWDAQTGQGILLLLGHTRGVGSVAFSADGKYLASGAPDYGPSVDGVFGPNGAQAMVWDAQTGQVLLTIKGDTKCLAFSPDGKRLATASLNGMVKVWNTQTGLELLSLKGHPGKGDAYGVAFSPDGTRLASASSDKTVKLWDAQTGRELHTLKGHTGWITSVIFSPDGKRLVSTSFDNTVKVWDAQTGQELLTVDGHTGGVNSMAFSPDGHRLAGGSNDGTVTIWDATPLPEKP